MKSGPEIVKAGLRSFFESASEDIEKMVENLKLGKVTQSRTQVKGVAQNINYTTVALLPVLTSLFEHIAQHQFGDDVIRERTAGARGARGQRGRGDGRGGRGVRGTWGWMLASLGMWGWVLASLGSWGLRGWMLGSLGS